MPENTEVTGTSCTLGSDLPTNCQPPGGHLTYDDGTPQPYYLTTPDWVYGPSGPAVITLPHRNYAHGSQVTQNASIYAFAIPLNPSKPLASVTLPDISDTLTQGDALDTPGLRIFAIGIRDTTTADLPSGAPSGSTWTGAWSAPNEGAFNLEGSNFSNQTLRTALPVTTAGSAVRLQFSNALGTNPLQIGHITVAMAVSGSDLTPAATPQTVTFGGSQSTTIPEGTEVYSDPISLNATPQQTMLISTYLQNSVPYLVQHSWADAYQYVSPVGSGDHTTDMTNTTFTANGALSGYFTDMLTGVDVLTSNTPTVAVLGDNLINPFSNGGITTSAVLATNRVPYDLTSTLLNNPSGPQYGILAEGIENNQITTDQAGQGGPSATSRLDRDILDQPNIGTVIIDEGLTDLLAGASQSTLADYDQELVSQLNAFGITAILTTLTPCDGYSLCTSSVDANRVAMNDIINTTTPGTTAPSEYGVDFDSAVAIPDPNSSTTPPEEELNTAAAPNDDDTGDHVNLTADAYANITNTIPLTDLTTNATPTN